MGETLLSGLVRAGRPVDELLVGEKRPERARELEEKYAVSVVSNLDATKRADTLALVVKPQDMGALLERDRPRGAARASSSVSLAAGITTVVPRVAAARRRRRSSGSCRTRRRWSTRAWPRSRPAPTATRSTSPMAEELLGSTGRVLRVPEKQMDAVTAISGSGPAYIFFVVESMIEAGVHLGLPRATATELVVQTARRLGEDAPRDRHPPDRAARAGHLARRHHRRRAARARDPQGARRVPGRHGGRARPLGRAGRGFLIEEAPMFRPRRAGP